MASGFPPIAIHYIYIRSYNLCNTPEGNIIYRLYVTTLWHKRHRIDYFKSEWQGVESRCWLEKLLSFCSKNIRTHRTNYVDTQSEQNCSTHFKSYCNMRANQIAWLRHQMETFAASLALCAGTSPVTDEFPSQRPMAWSFDVFFDVLNKRLNKQ